MLICGDEQLVPTSAFQQPSRMSANKGIKAVDDLIKVRIDDVAVSLPSEKNYMMWDVIMKAPEDTPYCDGIYTIELILKFWSNFPMWCTKSKNENINLSCKCG